ncbi:hypothetical protein [Sinorhizobium fredii]|uniref:hypothetical protein n=1 Tax=Rhizobium fredii TaxID=380 RepID=UPI0035168C41
MAALNDPRLNLEDIPFAQKRGWVARILHALHLLGSDNAGVVDHEIRSRDGLYHFGSLVRCTVEQRVIKKGQEAWTSSGGSMLEGFSAHPFGRNVLNNCIAAYLGNLPDSVRLIVLFGYGRNFGGASTGQPDRFSYVENVREAMESAFGQSMKKLNAVSYYNDRFIVVHVEHFSEPSNATHWIDKALNNRSRLRKLSFDAVRFALDREPTKEATAPDGNDVLETLSITTT